MSEPTGRSEAAVPTGIPSARAASHVRRDRIWEVDFLRGVSIILMVGYHLLYDLGTMVGLRSFLGFSTDLSTRTWTIAQLFFAGLFVVLSGVSSTLSRGNIRRALKLMAVALLVTAATFVFDRSSVIVFGILHCLAVSILLYGLFLEKAGAAACAGAGAFVIGLGIVLDRLLTGVPIGTDWLLPFGIHRPALGAFDYFPLFPWFGIFLVGATLGKSAYASKRSLFPWRFPITFVNLAGRHSLLIYIVHQPVILACLYVLGLIR
jgi:uncharacterized membrane protein